MFILYRVGGKLTISDYWLTTLAQITNGLKLYFYVRCSGPTYKRAWDKKIKSIVWISYGKSSKILFLPPLKHNVLLRKFFSHLFLKLIRFGDRTFLKGLYRLEARSRGSCRLFFPASLPYKLISYHSSHSHSSTFPPLRAARAEQLNSLFPFTYPFVSTFTFIFE